MTLVPCRLAGKTLAGRGTSPLFQELEDYSLRERSEKCVSISEELVDIRAS